MYFYSPWRGYDPASPIPKTEHDSSKNGKHRIRVDIPFKIINYQNKSLISIVACEPLPVLHSYFLSPDISFLTRASVSLELSCVAGGIRKPLICGWEAPILLPTLVPEVFLDLWDQGIYFHIRQRKFNSTSRQSPRGLAAEDKSIRTRIIAPD